MPMELKNINGNGGFTLVNTSNGGGFSLVVSGSNPSPSPTIGVSPSVTITPTPTDPPLTSVTPSITPTVTKTPSITPTVTISVTPSKTPSVTPTISITRTPSVTPTITVTPSISVTPSLTPTPTPSQAGVYMFSFDGTVGSSNFNTACSLYPVGGNGPLYSYNSTIQVGGALYTINNNGILSQPLNNQSSITLAVSGSSIYGVKVDTGGTITAIQQCNTPTYSIGQTALGGKIAYILQPGDPGYDANVQHGLVAYSFDLSGIWGCDGTQIAGADGTAIGTGYQNTLDIINGCATAGIAARQCDNLVAGGYNDWYLPSKDELNTLWGNRYSIGGFTDSQFYLSSSEVFYNGSYWAWSQYFLNGYQSNESKANGIRFRPIRSF
jgi:hypothetical protein